MLGSALYYPHIDIPDPMWLRSAILFWNEIQTIVPSAIQTPYQTKDTKICYQEGFLKPLHCEIHSQLIDDLGDEIVEALDTVASGGMQYRWYDSVSRSKPFFSLMSDSLGSLGVIKEVLYPTLLHSAKMSRRLNDLALEIGLAHNRGKREGEVSEQEILHKLHCARMHPKKMSYFLREVIDLEHHINNEGDEWLNVQGEFAEGYMSVLASKLAKQTSLSPLTSSAGAQGTSLYFTFRELLKPSKLDATGAIVAVIMRGLKIDPSVNVDRIIKFRRDRADQYSDFAGQISELKSQIENALSSDGDHNLEQAQALYDTAIEPSLRALKRELANQCISSVWDGAYRALTFSIPSASALAYITGLSGPALLGAGVALAATDIQVGSYLAGQRIRAGNPYSYLHDINSSFGLPEFGD